MLITNMIIYGTLYNNCLTDDDYENYCNYTDAEKEYYALRYSNIIMVDKSNNMHHIFAQSLKDVLIITFVIIMGTITATVYVSLTMNRNILDEFDEQIKDYEAYEDIYDNEFDNLSITNLSSEEIEKLKEKYIIEKTPNGQVIMKYNFETESFEYYSDNKRIVPYLHLETTAKHFVIENNCKIIFKEQSTPKPEPTDQNPTDQNPTDQNPTDQNPTDQTPTDQNHTGQNPTDQNPTDQKQKKSVFVSLKKYNAENTSKDSSLIESRDKLKKLANHYKYLGKLEDSFTSLKIPPAPPSPIIEETKSETATPDDSPKKEVTNETTEQSEEKSWTIIPNENLTFAEYKNQISKPN